MFELSIILTLFLTRVLTTNRMLGFEGDEIPSIWIFRKKMKHPPKRERWECQMEIGNHVVLVQL